MRYYCLCICDRACICVVYCSCVFMQTIHHNTYTTGIFIPAAILCATAGKSTVDGSIYDTGR